MHDAEDVDNDTVKFGRWSQIFQRKVVPPFSGLFFFIWDETRSVIMRKNERA
jgi:hypothetical protein